MKTITLTYCKSTIEAHRIKDVLEEQGIQCILQNENITHVLIPFPKFEIPIFVDEDDLKKAQDILKELFPEKIIGNDSIYYF
ncbi:MAG: putative signal transducing protein [Phocaeicola sp.]|uniref:putative signal transducing protein n=1 Tax=Phocaeicola TaxID=909656 RepID=UPI00234F63E6|nr:DUF2007 domain-containing protein [Phocaeicola oris]MCE2616243.1 DUF2007 domain-containing protein [Phocaeicola oris]